MKSILENWESAVKLDQHYDDGVPFVMALTQYWFAEIYFPESANQKLEKQWKPW